LWKHGDMTKSVLEQFRHIRRLTKQQGHEPVSASVPARAHPPLLPAGIWLPLPVMSD
jgi:hypothetical protein